MTPELSALFEAIMLILFGISWPINLRKLWKSKTTKGVSVLFYFLVVLGYICGLIAKYIMVKANPDVAWYVTVKPYVVVVYVINTCMVSCAILVYFRNLFYDKREDRRAKKEHDQYEREYHEHHGGDAHHDDLD